jgi:heat shock protein HslJ
MTKQNVILLVVLIAIGIVAFIVMGVAGNKSPAENPNGMIFVNAETRSSLVVVFGDDTATVTGEGYEDVVLEETGTEIGDRYVNDDEQLSLWYKGNEVTLWKGDTLLFSGTIDGAAPSPIAALTGGVWVWTETRMAAGEVVTPVKPGVFTMKFDSDEGNVSGTTDCNSFTGSFDATDEALTFGSLASTKMACEGSQEAVFTGALANVDGYIVPETGKLALVLKGAAGAMVFKKQ